MRIMILKTGKRVERPDSYAARLIEQGQAVPSPADPAPETPGDEAEQPKPRRKKAAKQHGA